MDTAAFLLELGAVLLALAVAARAGHRLGLSPIPLYLLTGLALGEGGLYPLVTAEGFIEVGAEIGVLLLLVMLGLEYTPDELIGGLKSTAPAAALDVVANFLPGLAAGLLLGWGPVAAFVLGGVTYISSSGVAAKLIDDLGWFANREVPFVLSLLVAEDLVMAAYLPLLSALLVGGGAVAVGGSAAVGLAAAAGALVVAATVGTRLSRWLHTPSAEALLLSVLGLTLVVAGLAEEVHISAAVGAFLVGIAFSGPVRDDARELLAPLRDLFAAVFFLFFGLAVDPRSLPSVLLVAAVLAVVTGLTKAAVAWWGTRRLGIGPNGRRRAAAALLARGEFSIVIAEIGVAAGLGVPIGPVSTAYVLLLSITGPVAARLATRTRS